MTEYILQVRRPGPSPKKEISKSVRILFYIFALYMILPVIDVPLLGLSLSAPIFFFIVVLVIFRPQRAWLRRYRRWVVLAGLIWLGILFSGLLNGLISGGIDIDNEGLLTIVRYAYWLLVFVVTAYVVSEGRLGPMVAQMLGWGAFVLALLRWMEVIRYGNIGAWTGTHLMSQNAYGFLFSIFSPFLFALLVETRGWTRWLAVIANLSLWGAAAINGSRGSWIAIGTASAVQLMLLWLTRPRRSALPVVIVLSTIVIGTLVLATPNPVALAVESRFSTFNKLEEDKSYVTRLLMNQKALRLFEESPLIGIGPSRFRKESIPLDIPLVLSNLGQSHYDSKSAHNSYLGFLAETGLIGAIPLGILLITLIFKGGMSAYFLMKRKQYWAAAVYGGFIGMSIHMWVINSLTNSANWMVYGLVAAVIMTAEQIRRSERQR